MTWYVVHCG
jgi:viroplasmin and RNaseH domain-containing protein